MRTSDRAPFSGPTCRTHFHLRCPHRATTLRVSRRKRVFSIQMARCAAGDTPRHVASFHPLKRISERSQNQRCEREDHREDPTPHTGHTAARASSPLSRSRRAQPSGPLAAVARGDGHSDARRRDLRQRRHQESHTLAAQQTSLAVFCGRRFSDFRGSTRPSRCSLSGLAGRWHPRGGLTGLGIRAGGRYGPWETPPRRCFL